MADSNEEAFLSFLFADAMLAEENHIAKLSVNLGRDYTRKWIFGYTTH
jgi:hypothetical protein